MLQGNLMKKWPSLVPTCVCRTEIKVTLYGEGLTEDGAPVEHSLGTLKCNYQDGAKTVLIEEKKLVEISGRAYFNGDICPEYAIISSGHVEIFGVKRDIIQGIKARNPDGTVNYTELRLK